MRKNYFVNLNYYKLLIIITNNNNNIPIAVRLINPISNFYIDLF